MNPFKAHAASQSELQGELGADCPTFAWNNGNWNIVPGTAIRRKDNAPGGFQLNADLGFTVLVAQFGVTAQVLADDMQATRLVYLGDGYRVSAVHIAPGAQQLHVECDSDVQLL